MANIRYIRWLRARRALMPFWPAPVWVYSHSFHVSHICNLTLTALGGGGGLGGPPDKFCRARKTAALSTAPLHDFFLLSLADILTPSLRKSDLSLRSHVIFCDQRSTQKVRIFSFCVQNKWQSEIFILAGKSVILSSFALYIINSAWYWSKWRSQTAENHKTIKFIKTKKQYNT